MSERLGKNPFLIIPIVLNLLVLLVVPLLLHENGLARATIVAVAALGAPWILFFIIGRVLDHVVRTTQEERDEAEHRDFV